MWQDGVWRNNWHNWFARVPENVELALACVVTNPIKMHVDGLGEFLLDCVIDDATCSAVISL